MTETLAPPATPAAPPATVPVRPVRQTAATKKATKKGRRNNAATVYPSWSEYMKKLTKGIESQTKISQTLGVSQTQISRWMRGYARPASLDFAIEAAAKLNGDVREAERAFKADGERRRGAVTKKANHTATKSAPTKPIAKAAPKPPAAEPKIDLPRPEMLALPNSMQEGIDELIEAQRAMIEAERALDEAVLRVRRSGVPWPQITEALQRATSD